MLVVHHPDQALHDPDTVFRTGRFIPQPDRAERYRIFLATVMGDHHEIVEAPLNRAEAITEVHDPAYVDFLKSVYARAGQSIPSTVRLRSPGCDNEFRVLPQFACWLVIRRRAERVRARVRSQPGHTWSS